MTEVNKETYILTIDNDATTTKITSVKKDDRELLNRENPIDLENEQNAIKQLNSAINQVPQDATQESADTPPPTPPVEEVVTPPQPPPPANLNLELKYSSGKSLGKTKFKGNSNDLIEQIRNSTTVKNKEDLIKTINGIVNSQDKETMKNSSINSLFKTNQYSSAKFVDNKLQGGNHHTRKRTHKPRNTKSNTRKGHIYRTNRRRTHGKSSAHGKKQTRRIVNH